MWYSWTKVEKANIPAHLRTRFQSLGVAVVSQVVARSEQQFEGAWKWPSFPLTPILEPIKTPIDEQRCAMAWLVEQHSRDERRRDMSEAVEIAILFVVAVEAVPVVASVFGWCWRSCLGG